jgi:hypothetical protein
MLFNGKNQVSQLQWVKYDFEEDIYNLCTGRNKIFIKKINHWSPIKKSCHSKIINMNQIKLING